MNNRESAYKHFMQEEMRIGKSYQDIFNAGYQACLASQAQQESQVIRKAFICPACECVYADSPVSHCDCFENHSNTYIEGSIIYTPAPEGEKPCEK